MLGGAAAFVALKTFYFSNINPDYRSRVLTIRHGDSFEEVLLKLKEMKVLKNEWSFVLAARIKAYPEHIKPGYYVLAKSLNNRQLLNVLKAGLQTPVTLVVYNISTKEQFASLLGKTLETDSAVFADSLFKSTFCARYDLDTETILTRFIPDNYELYWTTRPAEVFSKLNAGYQAFWKEDRLAKAKQKGLTPVEVYILASIVQRESVKKSDMPLIASVYLNRLKIGMALQADPTLIYATRDFNANRVNATHKEVESPYNTYKHTGLPPGPICMPSKAALDGVLNAPETDYLYFCANPDLSGYSVFSKNFEAHLKIARLYQRKLNALNIH